MNNSNLTAEQCIERLCLLQRLVVEEHFGYSRSADCFCGNSGFGAVHARSLSFRNEGHIIEFIEQAVREKLAHLSLGDRSPERIVSLFSQINHKLEVLMTNQTDLAASLTAANTKLDTIIVGVGKVKTETQGLKDEVTTLTAELGNVELTPEAQAALDGLNSRIGSLGSAVQDVDDLVPDAPTAATQGGGDSPAPTA